MLPSLLLFNTRIGAGAHTGQACTLKCSGGRLGLSQHEELTGALTDAFALASWHTWPSARIWIVQVCRCTAQRY